MLVRFLHWMKWKSYTFPGPAASTCVVLAARLGYVCACVADPFTVSALVLRNFGSNRVTQFLVYVVLLNSKNNSSKEKLKEFHPHD